MTTIRVARRDRFVVIDQQTVRDPLLSLRALGLLVRMLSYPDNWRFNSVTISNETREGRDAVRRAIAELEDANYLVRSKCRIDTATRKGLWVTELVLYEHPQLSTDKSPGRSDDGFPGVGNPGVGNPGANRKTVTKDCVDENSRTGTSKAPVAAVDKCETCQGVGWLDLDEETNTWQNRCPCVSASRRKGRRR